VERRWIGGACPNIACMPSKNEIANAKVAHLALHGAEHGVVAGSITIDTDARGSQKQKEPFEKDRRPHGDDWEARPRQGLFRQPMQLVLRAVGARGDADLPQCRKFGEKTSTTSFVVTMALA
jgi:hypothetical protein